MRNAPKKKKALEKRSIIALPAAMKPPRRTSAIIIPSNNTSCCLVLLTFSRFKIMTKTNILSTERAYSVSHPAKNAFWASGSGVQFGMKKPKINAALTYITVQIAASLIVVSILRRRIAIIKSIIITADKIPSVTNHVVVDSMAVLCQLVKYPDT